MVSVCMVSTTAAHSSHGVADGDDGRAARIDDSERRCNATQARQHAIDDGRASQHHIDSTIFIADTWSDPDTGNAIAQTAGQRSSQA